MKNLRQISENPRQFLNLLATVNVVIWMISIVAMIILIQDAPTVKKLAPILMAGTGAGVALISAIPRLE